MPDIEQRVALAVIARSPIERLVAFKKERGWRHLRLYADAGGDYTHDYVSADDADVPGYDVFTRPDDTIRHFWSGEMGPATADPGQDPRGAPTSCRYGLSSTPRPRAAARTGIRNLNILRRDGKGMPTLKSCRRAR